MFYDHRILTQRKYGVATVWLVATIGPKNTLSKKVHKKEILDVNVTKACRTILQSENPLALRLQSNLLFGVSRVFSEQYNYLFTDVANAHQKISRDFFVQLDTGQIDLVGARIRPEALLLQDDPAFVPELSFVLPELRLLPEDQLHHTTQLTLEDKTLLPSEDSLPHSVRGVGVSPLAQLIIPDSSSLNGGGLEFQPFFGDDFQGDDINQGGLDDGVDFTFDENGEIKDIPVRASHPHPEDFGISTEELLLRNQDNPAAIPKQNQWVTMPIGSERVRREHEDGKHILDLDDNLMDLDDLQDELFQARNANEEQGVEPFLLRQQKHHDDKIVVLVSHQRGKKLRLAQTDDSLELRTSDLAALGTKYLENMDQARRKRHNMQKVHAVKKTAREWVYGWSGMLRVGSLQATFEGGNILRLLNPNIGEMFSRETGLTKSRKRTLSHPAEGDDSDSEGSQQGRRIRSERADDHISRDLSPGIDDLGIGALDLDDQDPGVARRGSANLDGNMMPWNLPERGSRAGSVISFGGFGTSSVGGIPSSINRHFSSAGRHKGSPVVGASRMFGKRASRVTPSPSIRHNQVPFTDLGGAGRQGSPANTESDGDDILGIEEMVDYGFHEEMLPEEDPGKDASANKDTQNSRWLAETLERESYNFYEYLRSQLLCKYQNDLDVGNKGHFLTFDELISPAESSQFVAAQGFHHLLHLATRGTVRVKQGDYREPIIINLVVDG
ncbi:hypothetical protein TWF281_001259 [Arthrobotrys megalospora]